MQQQNSSTFPVFQDPYKPCAITSGLVNASQFFDEVRVFASFGSRSLSWNLVIIILGHVAVTLGSCVMAKLDLISVNMKHVRLLIQSNFS